ncbi:hypothetical protein F5Y15DRAFT_300268 [Xylariaceae sp. FL0016]|nr:hypothetical protein F5Y15DRAFT_300268 [Xylariaceae sp. FL0016]
MPPKRKRNDRASEATGNRPAPHRPSDTTLGQHDREYQEGFSQNRRGPGGGRNTRRNNDRRNSGGGPNLRHPSSPSIPRPTSSSSHTAPLAAPITPSTAQPSLPPSPINSNYNYAVLTEARISAWQQSGRQEVVEHGIESRSDEDIEEISTISQEFAQAVLENRINPNDAGSCMRQILGPEVEKDDDLDFNFDAQTLFLDTISVFIDSDDTQTSSNLRDFIVATGISPKLLRQALDGQALIQLGLIRDTFVRLGIRYATNQLYRQANYNLLREESEGYSKLAAELYRTPYQSQGHHDFALVQACWERVKALIGTFDLDVGRVLDVVIDVFSATMLRNIVFFSRLLRISSWWPRNQIDHSSKVFTGGLPKWALPQNENTSPESLRAELLEQAHQRDLTFWDRARQVHLDAFFELGGRRVEEAELQRILDAANSSTGVDFQTQWIQATKTLPPCGNRVAAQLLGFKFRFYASDARDKAETLPANLYYLAAFLIKIGFISLADLYPHLWPSDDAMDALRLRREAELAEKERNARQGAEPNALLMAAALPDDDEKKLPMKSRDPIVSKTDNKEQESSTAQEDENILPEPKEAQKADLVSHLLVVGAIPEALFIIGQFPWLPEAYPDEIYPAINRILLHSVSKVYDDSRSTELRPTTGAFIKPEIAADQSGMPKGSLRLQDGSPIKILKWPHADGISKGTLYRFYLDDWVDNVPVCQTLDDLFTLCNTLLNISGVNIGRDPVLVKKIAAIGAKSLYQDRSPENSARWQDLLRRVLVPCLALTNANVDAVVAIWELLKHYPTRLRYAIYADCFEGSISRLPAMRQAFKNARLDTLATLKRLAASNIPTSAKKLAKIALSSPAVVCKVALDQIEAYTNLIEAFVECTKYFTEMGYDILVWSLLSSLGGKQRSRTQETSVLLASRWLQALSKFSGKVFRRFGTVDVTPVVQYVNDQVAQGSSTDLVILRELITSMAGIIPATDFTDAQVSALSGDEILRRQTLISLGDKRFESEKSASRLMRALSETNIAPQLLTNMAQYRQSAIYQLPESETHIKYLATVIDDSHQALVQYVDLLRSNLTPEEFDARVPGIPTLMADFGLDTNIAFMIGRDSLRYYLTGPGGKAAPKTAIEADSDAVMDVNGGGISTSGPDESEDHMLIDTPETIAHSPKQPVASVATTNKSDRMLEFLSPIIDFLKTFMPSGTWAKMSPELYVLFWSLQSGDIHTPSSNYTAEQERALKEHNELKKESASGKAVEKKKAKMEHCERLVQGLRAELSVCKERVSKTRLLLSKQSPIWFDPAVTADSVTDALIEECLLPRMLFSPGDADFCHRFVMLLHFCRLPNLKLANLYDRFFNANRLRSVIFGCTVREAEFLGRFIKLTLANLATWHKKKSEYEKYAIGLGRYGFATGLDDNGKPVSYMEHDKFRDLLWTWHRNLLSALKSCLVGAEWMHIRNAITILKTVLEHFPAVDFVGKQFQQLLTKIAAREAATKSSGEDGQGHRVDLSVAANTALSALKKHSSEWVMVQAFRPNTSGDTAEDKKAMELSKSQSSALRPGAPEFKPQPTSVPTRSKTNAGDEDGEIKSGQAHLASAQLSSTAVEKGSEPARSLPAQQDANSRPNSTPQKPEPRSAPRSSTPKNLGNPPPPNLGPRQDPSRSSILTPAPGLPSRPEVPFPAHFTHDQFGTIKQSHLRDHRDPRDPRDTRDQRDSREPREPREARDSREPREPRDNRDPRSLRPADDHRPTRARDHQTTDRRATESLPRDPQRSDRDRQVHRPDSARRNEPGQQDRDARTSRDRGPTPATTARIAETARGPRDSPAAPKSMPPPPQPDVPGPTVNPERAHLINLDHPDDRPNMVNPARAALIQDSRPGGRPGREDSRDRQSPRVPSPRRGDRSETRHSEPHRDDRAGRTHRAEHHGSARDHSTSKNSRHFDHDSERPGTDRSRDSGAFQGPLAGRGESDHGRLNSQDPDYGRLNSIPSVVDIGNAPEGPRGRGRTSTRPTANNPPPRSEPRFQGSEPHRQPSPDRHHPPTGPASSRPRRNLPGGQQNSASSPVAAGTPAGIHPERLRQLNVPGPSGSPSQHSYPAPAPAPVPVHPDRLSHIAPQNPHLGGRSLPPLHTPERPSPGGPPNHRQPSGHIPVTPGLDNSPMSAPTGPAAANDRTRGGGRRQLSGINNILQGGPQVRSRSSRSNLAGSDAQVLTGASPVSTPVHERSDPFFSSDRNGGERHGRGDPDRGRREHDGADRPPRQGRRTSREHSSDRGQRGKETRDYRERKSDVGTPNHGREAERETLRRSTRESNGTGRESLPAPGRSDLVGNGRDGPRESRHRTDGGSGRHEEYGRSGGGSRGGRGDDRRESRGGLEDHGRKRRSGDEFVGGRPSDKRQRR